MAEGSKSILEALLAGNQAKDTEELLKRVCRTPGAIMNFCRREELKLLAKLLEIEQPDNLFIRHVTEYCSVSMQLCDSNREELSLGGAPRCTPGNKQMSAFAKMDMEEETDSARIRRNAMHDVPVEQIALNQVDDYMSAFPIDPFEVTYIEAKKTERPSENSLVLNVMEMIADLSKNPPEYLGGAKSCTGGGTYGGDKMNAHSKDQGLPLTAGELKEAQIKLLELIKEDEKRIMKEEE